MMRGILLFLALTLGCSAIAVSRDSFGFATWNVGHFAQGRKSCSAIASADVPPQAARYRKFLTEANVSVLGVCEHAQGFSDDGATSSAKTAFADFPNAAVGPANGWQENALYWKDAELISSGHADFPKRRQKCYCQWTRLRILGREVCFVEAHCDWQTDAGHEDDRVDQMRFLIRTFGGEHHVVIAGDFNNAVRDAVTGKWRDEPDEFEVFRRAGFAAAHWGEVKTWPASAPRQAIDNIFVKGFDVEDVTVQADPALSDHALLRGTLTFQEGGK